MKTITFYSYKGGVGRSLALSNIAIKLSEYKKRVCIIDFDLEAPGLHFKFNQYSQSSKIERGIVDYVYGYIYEGRQSQDFKEFSINLQPANRQFETIHLIPAGNIDDYGYWKKLSEIDWSGIFNDSKLGVSFFLDLKQKIQKSFNPDFLLIDSRTGITEISGITLRILADEVVILAANNEENIYGTSRVIKKLTSQSELLLKKPQRITFLLTRLPFSDSVRDKFKERKIVDKRVNQIKKFTGLENIDAFVIHSDRRLEENEQPLIGDEYDLQSVSISNDYLKLFERLTGDVLLPEEVTLFRNNKKAEREFEKGIHEKDEAEKLIHFNAAIKFNSNQHYFYIARGQVFNKLKRFDEAMKDFHYALELNANLNEANMGIVDIHLSKKEYDFAANTIEKILEKSPNNLPALNAKAFIYLKSGKFKEALEILNILIEDYPENDFLLNYRADLFRELGDFNQAYKDIFKAIDLNPNEGVFYATLAEIYLSDNRIDEFYLNLGIALSKDISGADLSTAKSVYEKVKDDSRFQELLDRFSIDPNEIFEN